MLEAYIALPAFELGYFLSSIAPWPKKIRNLILANIILLVVSFSWIFVVDMTPPSNRPYVGSSQTNSEFNLAIGYNGIQRITGMFRSGRRTPEIPLPAAKLKCHQEISIAADLVLMGVHRDRFVCSMDSTEAK